MIAFSIAATVLVYAFGVRAAWKRAGLGRAITLRQVTAFAIGIAVVIVALLSPLDAMADDLFAAHMTQHMLLAAMAPPFLVFGAPMTALVWAMPAARRRGAVAFIRERRTVRLAWSWLTAPAVAVLLHLVAIWLWHAPALYERALRSEWIHALEHLSFVGTATLLWWPIAHPRAARRTAYAIGLASLFITAMQTGVLGALIALSHHVWYPSQTASAAAWGFTPMQDQTLAGLIMWVPGGMIYVVAMSVLFVKWLEPRHFGRREESANSPAGRLAYGEARPLASLGLTLLIVQLASCTRASASSVPGGDVARGRQSIEAMGCGACHVIPGVANAHGLVGPPLSGIALRSILAGELPNTPENMMRWIQDPPSIEANTAMPNLGVTSQAARDITAYLYTLR